MAAQTRTGLVAALIVLAAVVSLPLRHAPYVYEDANWLGHPVTEWRIPSRALTYWTFSQTTEPGTAHLGNVAIHLVNGVLVAGVAAALIPGPAAVWAAGLYLLHPLNSAAVSYVSGRTDLLMTFCALLAVLGALRAWWPLVGLGLVGAALSKELGLIAVPLVWLTLWRFRPETRRAQRLLLVCGLAALALNLPTLRGWFQLAPTAGGSVFTAHEYAALQMTAFWHLASMVVIPDGFSIDHDIVGIAEPWRTVAVLLTGTVLALAASLWGHARLFTWCVCWVAVAMLPRLVFRTNELLTEPQMLLPLIGIWIGLGAACASLTASAPARKDAYEWQ